MKKSFYTYYFYTLLLFFGCNRTTHLGKAVGNDKDANGCIGSAGYQWSKLKNECIRTFELPIQLSNNDQTFSAGVFITIDLKQAEVFTKDGVFVLNIQSNGSYKSEKANEIYSLNKVNNKWEFGNIKNAEPSYKEQ